MTAAGHNLPNPLELAPGEIYRIPGHLRCFQLIAQELTAWVLEASLDGEHFEPLRTRQGFGELLEHSAPWFYVRFIRHSGDGRMLVSWVDG